jgi:hypothetical protein
MKPLRQLFNARGEVRTQTLVIISIGLVVVAATGIVVAVIRHGFTPGTGALITAWATIVGAVIAQVVNTRLAAERADDDALRTYLERMEQLVSGEKLRTLEEPYNEKRILARVQTKMVLRGLSPARKREVLEFLREMRLINRYEGKLEGATIYPRIVGLGGADLSNADLRGMKLINAARDEPVSLEGAILEEANLTGADLERADLRDAILTGAVLRGTNLIGADLKDANGLTQEQVKQAYGSNQWTEDDMPDTELPDDLEKPPAWREPLEEQKRTKADR